MGKKIYKAESFKVQKHRKYAKELETFINEHVSQGWIFEQFELDPWHINVWCHVLFSREEG